MKRLLAFLASALLALTAHAQTRTWTTVLQFETCGCKIAYTEVYLPGEETPILTIGTRFAVQWTWEPGDGSASSTEALREMSKRGYYQYVVYILPTENSTVAEPKSFYLTPFGVAFTDPGPPPELDGKETWNEWFSSHSWGHKDWGKEFRKLWFQPGASITFTLTLRSKFCVEKGEPNV